MIDVINAMLAQIRILACFMSMFVYRLCIDISEQHPQRIPLACASAGIPASGAVPNRLDKPEVQRFHIVYERLLREGPLRKRCPCES
jgi:hypothetical protein